MSDSAAHQYPAFLHVKDPQQLARLRELDEQGNWDLEQFEIWWRNRYHILKEHGYEVRPRFRPDWKPSWRGTDLDAMLMEDSIPLSVSSCLT